MVQVRHRYCRFGAAAPLIGKTFGNYTIKSQLGAGGMGSVFLGFDTALERPVAVKVLSDHITGDEIAMQRFRIEAVSLAKLSHPNIASVYSFFEADAKYLLVLEFVDGKTLLEVLRSRGAFKAGEAALLIGQALGGLSHAHDKGIIHRDIKPANLMLTRGGVVKLTDFGIARVEGNAGLTRADKIVGTPKYMSPEQVQHLPLDARSDIYSMGVVLYELVAGSPPFTSGTGYDMMRAHVETPPPSLRSANPSVPKGLEKVILKALSKKPEDRYATAMDFRNALKPFAQDFVSSAPASGTSGSPSKENVTPVFGSRAPQVASPSSAKPFPKGILYASGILVLLVGAIVVVTRSGGAAKNPAPQPAPAPVVKVDGEPTPNDKKRPEEKLPPQPTIADMLTSADAETDPANAINLYHQVLQIESGNPAAKSGLVRLSKDLVKQGESGYDGRNEKKRSRAVQLWRLAAEADPQNDIAFQDLAVAAHDRGDDNEALRQIHIAMSLDPKNELYPQFEKEIQDKLNQ